MNIKKIKRVHKLLFAIFLSILVIGVFLDLSQAKTNGLNVEKILAKTAYETEIYYLSSQQEGPIVMVLSGVHGNELAGITATYEIIPEISLTRGKLIIVPEANRQACIKEKRCFPSKMDLNRLYPGDIFSKDLARLAVELFNIMKNNKIDFLIDLHESIDFYRNNPSRYGQTIVIDSNDQSLKKFSQDIVCDINRNITKSNHLFQVIIKPIKGCSTYEAYNRLNIPAITFETCQKIDFNLRVYYHQQCIKAILNHFNMI